MIPCNFDFLSTPDDTARAQAVYHQLACSPVGVLMVDLIEIKREKIICEQAQRELLWPSRKSPVETELENRIIVLRDSGYKFWRLGLKEKAVATWAEQDRLIDSFDDYQNRQRAIFPVPREAGVNKAAPARDIKQ